MVRSDAMLFATHGWRNLIATVAVGTDGEGSGMIDGAMAFGPDFGVRLGSKYDGGSKFCFNVARYTCTYIIVEHDVRVDKT